MVKVNGQNIPSEMLNLYGQVLEPSVDVKNTSRAKKRYPWRLPHMQSASLSTPSAAQLEVRKAFKNCTRCFAIQPGTSGAIPPEKGPRGRDWWYNQSLGSGLFYYDYFMQQTFAGYYAGPIPDWCMLGVLAGHPGNYVKDRHPNDTFSYNYGCPALNYPKTGWGYKYYGEWRGYIQFDLTQANLESIIPNYSPGMITGATLRATLWNQNLRNAENDQFFNQTGSVYFAHVSYWNPATLNWNNKPAVGNLVFQRTSEVYEYYGQYYNDGFSEHSVDVSGPVVAAIGLASPYCTLLLKITPPAPDADLYTDPDWRVGGVNPPDECELIFS